MKVIVSPGSTNLKVRNFSLLSQLTEGLKLRFSISFFSTALSFPFFSHIFSTTKQTWYATTQKIELLETITRRERKGIRRSVEIVDAEAEGFADGGDGVVFGDGAEDSTKRRSPKTNAAQLQPRVPQRSELQVW